MDLIYLVKVLVRRKWTIIFCLILGIAGGLLFSFLAPKRYLSNAQYSTGFVYLVSRTGVTGEQESLSAAVAPLIRSVRAVTDLPLAVGFGVSKAAHVAELGAQVEAVVVGSAIVRVIEQNPGPKLEARLEEFTRGLKNGFGAHA